MRGENDPIVLSPATAMHALTAPAATPAPVHEVPLPTVLLLAGGAGLAVASLYYSQPLLGVLGADIHAGPRAIGLVPTLTQLGYALGIFFLAPLGDRIDRRRLILAKAVALTIALLLCAAAPSAGLLLLASLAVGWTATLAQDIVPAAATLAHETRRGRVVGTVMTGLLTGILLSRVASGFVAQAFGWRAVYALAAGGVALFGLAAWRAMPRIAPTSTHGYLQLLRSSVDLWRRHGALRRAALAQGLLSLGFSAFWSTLAVMLHGAPWHFGSAVAGSFGLAGAAGALAAPLAGRVADRRGPALVTKFGTGLAAAAFLAMGLAAALPPALQLPVLVAGTIVFDLGVQATLVSHQTIVYGLDPAARSRLNALLFTGMFIGMSTGAALAGALQQRAGWAGVMALATASSLAALAVRMWPRR
jgi:predicted MFS family arabinose efflux permease